MRFSTVVCLIWIGIIIGISFVATPAKFLATTVSLVDALAIGRATFSVFFWIECALFILLTYLVALDKGLSFDLFGMLLVLLGLLVTNYLVIQPILYQRVQSLIDGHVIEPSSMHRLYILLETLKLLWLTCLSWKITFNERFKYV